MSLVDIKSLSKEEKDKMVCTYAAMLLHDGGVKVTEEKMTKLISASGNQVEGYWPGLFAKALVGRDIDALINSTGGDAGAAVDAGAAAPVEEAKGGDKKDAKKKDDSDGDDDANFDGLGGMFGDDY